MTRSVSTQNGIEPQNAAHINFDKFDALFEVMESAITDALK